METLTIVLLIVIVGLIFYIIYLMDMLHKRKRRNENQALRLLEKEQEIERKEGIILTFKKAAEIKSNGNRLSPKAISMYKKAGAESQAGIEYIFLETYDSVRKAEADTKIRRNTISYSVKKGALVKHKGLNIEVLFAPKENNLKSNEK